MNNSGIQRQLYEWKWSKHTNQSIPKSKKKHNIYNNTSHEHFIQNFNKFEQNDKIHHETNTYIGEYKIDSYTDSNINTNTNMKQHTHQYDKSKRKKRNNVIKNEHGQEEDMFEFKYKFTRENDKEKINEKKSRISLIQTNINPYLKANKYIDDIKIQDNYLRPINSNIELQ